MNNRIAGSILLGAAGLTATIGVVGTQIAYALVKSGFYAGQMSGAVPSGPEHVSLHWMVLASVCVLTVLGTYFLFTLDKPE